MLHRGVSPEKYLKVLVIMPYCVVKLCTKCSATSSYSKDGITFHRFPKVPEMKEKWINAIDRVNWFPTKTSVVCSRHFTPDCFEHLKNNRRRLYASAIPTLYMPVVVKPNDKTNSSGQNGGQTRRSKQKKKNIQASESDDLHILESLQSDVRPSSLKHSSNLSDSQNEDLVLQMRRLERRMNNLVFCLSKKNKKIKKLQYRNRLLRSRVVKLRDIILASLTNKDD